MEAEQLELPAPNWPTPEYHCFFRQCRWKYYGGAAYNKAGQYVHTNGDHRCSDQYVIVHMQNPFVVIKDIYDNLIEIVEYGRLAGTANRRIKRLVRQKDLVVLEVKDERTK